MSIKSLSIKSPPSKSAGFYQDNTYLGNEVSIVVLQITRKRFHDSSGCSSSDLQVGSMHGNCLDCKFNFLRKELNSCKDSYHIVFTMADNPNQTYSLKLEEELVPQVVALERVLDSFQSTGTRGARRIINVSLKSLTKIDFFVSPTIPSKKFTSALDKWQTANS